jgi:hypothetical protein
VFFDTFHVPESHRIRTGELALAVYLPDSRNVWDDRHCSWSNPSAIVSLTVCSGELIMT